MRSIVIPLCMLVIIVYVMVSFPACVQNVSSPYPLEKDVSTLDGIITAYYEVVSGPAGQPREVERDKSLHHPEARVTITGVGENSQPYARVMSLEDYHRLAAESGNPAFYEEEIVRSKQSFGNITHVWSTYVWRDELDGPIKGRGINSIQLYFDGDRWWITSWIYDSERPDNPLLSVPLPTAQD